ncbi:hypothetical protein FG05_35325 [Fusarium graminearum]|nr:hypothetical protein FG05_35325 [Fusarium graminearum]
MCLPCFPWTWTKVEDPYDEMHKAPDQSVWVHDGQGWELQKLLLVPWGTLLFTANPVTLHMGNRLC